MGRDRRLGRSGIALALGLLAGPAAAAPTYPIEETTSQRTGVPSTSWHTILAAGGKAKIWAQTGIPDDLPKAERIAAELTSHIWPQLTGLFWEPLSDENVTYEGVNGPYLMDADASGGPQLDIYLVRQSTGPVDRDVGGGAYAAIPSRPCGNNPRYLTLESGRPLGGARGDGILNILAHELAHAIHHAVPWLDEDCERYRWIDEATATWAEHFIYPDSQTEHERAVQYLYSTEQPLDFTMNDSDPRYYGLYLLPLEIGLRGVKLRIPAMWQQFARKKPLAGIEAVLGEKYDVFFPRFALDNWNREPVDLYRQKDKLTDGARVPVDPEVVSLAGGKWEKKIPLDIKYLAATYRYFRFPAGVKTVTFDNGLYGHPHAKTWAIEKVAGAWKTPRELTTLGGETWCDGQKGGDLDELVLVFSNTDWPSTPVKEANKTAMIARGESELAAYATGCVAWVGTTSLRHTVRADTVTSVETADASVRFELNPDLNDPGHPPEYWHAVSGTMRWTSSMSGECNGSHSGTLPIEVDAHGNEAGTLQIYDPAGPGAGSPVRRYSGGVGPFPVEIEPKFTFRCANGVVLNAGLTIGATWFLTDPDGHDFPEGTTTISGRFELPGMPPGVETVWTWSLRQSP